MKKRNLFAMFAAIAIMAMPLTAGILTVSAEESYDPEGYEYEINDDGETVTITYYQGDDERWFNYEYDVNDYFRHKTDHSDVVADEVIEIPAEIDGYRVTAIGDRAFYEYPFMKEVIIPDGVTSIGSEAFYREIDSSSDNTFTLTIPASVEYIGGDIVDCLRTGKAISHETEMAISNWIIHHNILIMKHEENPERFELPDDMELFESIDQRYFAITGELRTLDGREVSLSELGIEETSMINDTKCVIRGYSGSCAEDYAKHENIPFESIGTAPLTGSAFSGGALALAGISGLALGIVGTSLVTLPKKKKEA